MSTRRAACPCCQGEAEWLCTPEPEQELPTVSRRLLLRTAVGLAGASLVSPALAQIGGAPRSIAIARVQTGERFAGAYWQDGRYNTEALRQLDWVMRDPALDEATPMDPRLFDVLFAVSQRIGGSDTFEVISGYRSPETNAANARRSRRVSKASLHMSGMAADVRLVGANSMGMARLAAEMQVGGVGLYRRDGFVHLDCGPVRRW